MTTARLETVRPSSSEMKSGGAETSPGRQASPVATAGIANSAPNF
jgi:hypothetical protein